MNLRALTRADFAIGGAVLILVWAAATPWLRGRAFHDRVERADAEVIRLRDAALSEFGTSGAWPSTAAPGDPPPELAGTYPEGPGTLAFDDFRVEWMQLSEIGYEDAPPPPPPTLGPDEQPGEEQPPIDPEDDEPEEEPDSVAPDQIPMVLRAGAVVVHSPEEGLLAELLSRYGPTRSYVRDSTWTLVVPRPGDGNG